MYKYKKIFIKKYKSNHSKFKVFLNIKRHCLAITFLSFIDFIIKVTFFEDRSKTKLEVRQFAGAFV